MQFLYVYPDLHGSAGDMLDAGSVTEVARAAEASGWDGIAFTEHPVPSAKWLESGGHQALDPFVALAAAGAVTERLRLLTFLTVIPYRNPALLAKTAATVDRVSNGRFILGAGTGYLKSEFFALGVDFDERNALFDEALDVLPLHWSGEPFDYEGRHFNIRGAIGRPAPVQQPIPIWIGGNAPITRRRVAERAQGWMPLLGPAQVSATARTPHIGDLDDLASKIGEVKDLAGDRAVGLDFAIAYTDPTVVDPTVDVERHRDAFGALEEAGATWIIVSGATAEASATLDFLAAFGDAHRS
jgi:probable F420-dependent oxidoreductase